MCHKEMIVYRGNGEFICPNSVYDYPIAYLLGSFMHSLLPDYLAKLRFDAQQLATLRALGEYRGKQQLKQLLEQEGYQYEN